MGFVLYRLLMYVDIPVGYTLVDMAVTALLCVAAGARVPQEGRGVMQIKKTGGRAASSGLFLSRGRETGKICEKYLKRPRSFQLCFSFPS